MRLSFLIALLLALAGCKLTSFYYQLDPFYFNAYNAVGESSIKMSGPNGRSGSWSQNVEVFRQTRWLTYGKVPSLQDRFDRITASYGYLDTIRQTVDPTKVYTGGWTIDLEMLSGPTDWLTCRVEGFAFDSLAPGGFVTVSPRFDGRTPLKTGRSSKRLINGNEVDTRLFSGFESTMDALPSSAYRLNIDSLILAENRGVQELYATVRAPDDRQMWHYHISQP